VEGAGECENYGAIKGAHKNSVMEVEWTNDGSSLVSCGADRCVCMFDSGTGERVKKYSAHSGVVNGCCCSRRHGAIFASGSDDHTARVWDARTPGGPTPSGWRRSSL